MKKLIIVITFLIILFVITNCNQDIQSEELSEEKRKELKKKREESEKIENEQKGKFKDIINDVKWYSRSRNKS